MNTIFRDPEIIYNKVVGRLPQSVSMNDVIELVLDAELNYISDFEMLARYVDVKLLVNKTTRQAIIPCNVKRIVDVYNSNKVPLKYSLLGSNRIKLDEYQEYVYMDYIGHHVNDNGYPVIRESHIGALETFVIKHYMENDFFLKKESIQNIDYFSNKFSNQVTALKQNWGHIDHEMHNKIEAIRWNMLPLAAQRQLLHRYYESY